MIFLRLMVQAPLYGTVACLLALPYLAGGLFLYALVVGGDLLAWLGSLLNQFAEIVPTRRGRTGSNLTAEDRTLWLQLLVAAFVSLLVHFRIQRVAVRLTGTSMGGHLWSLFIPGGQWIARPGFLLMGLAIFSVFGLHHGGEPGQRSVADIDLFVIGDFWSYLLFSYRQQFLLLILLMVIFATSGFASILNVLEVERRYRTFLAGASRFFLLGIVYLAMSCAVLVFAVYPALRELYQATGFTGATSFHILLLAQWIWCFSALSVAAAILMEARLARARAG